MARPSLAELKNRFKEKEQKKTTFFSSDYYPFTKMDVGAEAHVRLLQDLDEENPMQFTVERLEHTILINGNEERIPCLQMYGEDCPICERSSKWYKAAKAAGENTKSADGELGPNAKKGKYYLKKSSNLVRVIVTKDPLPPGDTGSWEGKVATLNLSFQVYNRLIADLATLDDSDPVPYDLDGGIDFVIRKTLNSGGKADYSSSGFARKASTIPEKWRTDLKLINLSTLLPKNPGLEEVVAKLEAHDTGAEYQKPEKEEKAAKEEPKSAAKEEPTAKAVAESKPVEKAAPQEEPVKEEAKPAAATSAAESDDNEDEILRRIRLRNKK